MESTEHFEQLEIESFPRFCDELLLAVAYNLAEEFRHVESKKLLIVSEDLIHELSSNLIFTKAAHECV